ncbi:hypothetical protein K440DRAFT_661072 [Wilcoxina mikolae CBS 423.85]|nr:hypothetical protein K440DRAFT_661072 [Wilcoxina mikolae CBS 423.85]
MANSEPDPEPDPDALLQGNGKDLNLLRTLFSHLSRPNDDDIRPTNDDGLPVISDHPPKRLRSRPRQAPPSTQPRLASPKPEHDSLLITCGLPAQQPMDPPPAPPTLTRLNSQDADKGLPVTSDIPSEQLMPPPPPPPTPKHTRANQRKRKATSPPRTNITTHIRTNFTLPIRHRSPLPRLTSPTPLPLPPPSERSYPEHLNPYQRFCLKRKLAMMEIRLYNAERHRQSQRIAEQRITERIEKRIEEYEKQTEGKKKPERALGWKVAQFEHEWREMIGVVKGLGKRKDDEVVGGKEGEKDDEKTEG